jgi:FMNH2-dependent dimethyl sulfone monooxygenase
VLAKWIATADQITDGRLAINVVSGWFKDEFTKLGEPWLEHGERYRRAEEFIRYVREIWTSDHAEFNGDFYNLHDFDLKPKPVTRADRPHPEIFMGGNSTDARGMGGRVTDWYFANGNTPEGIHEQVRDVSDVATVHGRTVKFGVNGFLIGRDTEAEARDVLREIIDKADREAVEGFGSAVKQAGQSTGDKKGMWQDSEFADLVQYNDGFRTGLIGTPEQIATRMVEYKKLGVNLFLLGFLHYHEDVEYFGREVLPLVRELEAAELERV